MGVFEDQRDLLKAQMAASNDRIASLQQQLTAAQTERQVLQQRLQDLRDAYQAWKGTPLGNQPGGQ